MEAFVSAQSSLRIRLGMAALALAGLLFVTGVAVRGAFGDPAADPVGYARTAGAAGFAFAWVVIIVGFVVQVPGFLALYVFVAGLRLPPRLERPAFWGLLLSLFGTLLALPPLGFLPFEAPVVAHLYQSGQTAVIQVATASLGQPPALIFLIVSGVLYTVGSILFGIAIWRSGILPRWAAIPYALQAPLLTFGPQISYVAEFLGAVLLLGSAIWLAWAIWRPTAPRRSPAIAQP